MQHPNIDVEALKNDPEFQENLKLLEQECKETQSVAKGYQLLDAYLVIEKDEESLNELFGFLVNNAFDKLATYLTEHKSFDVRNNDEERAVARALYEYGMQRYSENDTKGAKEIFLVLHHTVADEELKDAMMVHAAAVMAGNSFENFIDNVVKLDDVNPADPLAVFVKDFVQPTDILLEMWKKYVDEGKEELKVLENEERKNEG